MDGSKEMGLHSSMGQGRTMRHHYVLDGVPELLA